MTAPKKFDDKTMTGREIRDLSAVVNGPEDPLNAWAYYWIAKRREDKSFTWDEALDLPLTEVVDFLGIDTPLTTGK